MSTWLQPIIFGVAFGAAFALTWTLVQRRNKRRIDPALVDKSESTSDENRSSPQDDNLMAVYLRTLDKSKVAYLGDLKQVYQQLCSSYRAIDDFRAKLLGFLPLATGTGIFLLLDKLNIGADDLTAEARGFLVAVGVFGIFITLGLFSYEIYGIKKCDALIKTGRDLEDVLHLKGQFNTRPQNVVYLVNEPFAAGVIYPTVLAGWTFFALAFKWPEANPEIPIIVFIAGFACTLIYDWSLRRDGKSSACK